MDINDIKNKLEGREPKTIDITHEFSILMLMTEKDGEALFVFEKRAKGINQPGDYCFPGGFVEEGENASEAALRETYEEIGIRPDDIRVIGEFDTLYLGKRAIHSFIGYAGYDTVLNAELEKTEVDCLVMIPVSYFSKENQTVVMLPQKIITKDFPYEKYGIDPNYPWYEPDRKIIIYEPYNGHTIWGLTARFINALMSD